MLVNYPAGSVKAIGELHLPPGEGPFPTLILLPYYKGIDQVARDYARDIIATNGWAVFIADYYGDGKSTTSDQEAASWYPSLFLDREEMRKRVKGAFDAVEKLPQVNRAQLGAIGFCFGGLAAIELFKQGLPLKGVAAFHALLGYRKDGKEAKKLPIAKNISTSLLIMNGYKDPLVSAEDRLNFEKEMDEAGLDWQYHIYGKAAHAFTNPEADDPSGLYYEPLAASRSFDLMLSFFTEVFEKWE
jgi:dienelactone hydrolase